MVLIVVELVYDEPLTDEAVTEMRWRLGPSFVLRRISHVTSYLSHDRLRAMCVYRAPDVAAVRDAHEQELPNYVQIWCADAI